MSKIVGYLDDDVADYAHHAYNGYFDDDYDEQAGGLLQEVFMEHQAGRGWGTRAARAIARGASRLFKPMIPLLKKGGLALGKQALASAGGYLGDLMSGSNWRKAGSERLNEAGTNIEQKYHDKMGRMVGAGGQYGEGGHKTIQHGVKLFSFSPPSAPSGRVAVKRRRRRRVTKRKTATTPKKRRVTRRRKQPATRRRRRKATTTVRRRRTTRTRALQQGSGYFEL